MRGILNAIVAVAINTTREAIRDKVLYAIVFFGAVALACTLVLAELALYEDVRIVRDLSLAGANLLVVLVAVFLGVTLLHKEIDRRTILTLLSKPLHRWQFIVGKYLGMAATLLLLLVMLAGEIWLLLLLQDSTLDGPMVRALLLCAFEVLVVTGVAMLFSSWTRPFLSGLLTMGVFVLGRAGEDLGILAQRLTGPMRIVAEAAHRVAPNLHLFYVSGYEVRAKHVSIHGYFIDWPYIGYAAGYAGLYVVGTLLFAILLFRKRDFL